MQEVIESLMAFSREHKDFRLTEVGQTDKMKYLFKYKTVSKMSQ